MPAMLERNGKDGRPTTSNLPPQEVIRCNGDGCECSYTLSYDDGEIRMVGNENNIDKMRRTAIEIIEKDHPAHFTKVFLCKSIGTAPECHWFEADSLAARAAL